MADIRLITIVPAQTVGGVQPSQGSPGAPSQAGGLLSLPPGTILSGFIINRDATGNPILRTDKGDVVFASHFFLKIGSEVVIRVENNPSGTLAHILSVNGQPPEIAAQQSSFAEEPDIILGQNITPRPAQLATIQAVQPLAPASTASPSSIRVNGTLIAASPPAGNAPAPPPVGTQLAFTILTVTPPVSSVPEEFLLAAAPPPATIPAAPANPASYSAYAKATGSVVPPALSSASPLPSIADAITARAAQSPPVPPAGLPAAVTAVTASPAATETAGLAAPGIIPTPYVATPTASVVRPTITATTATPPAPLQAGQIITATIIAREPTGEALVQIPAGVLRVPSASVPATGSNITLEIAHVTLPAPQANARAADMPAPLPELARQWTSLQQIVSLLSERSAATGFSFVQPNMPWLTLPAAGTPPANNVPQTMSAGLMLFMSALRGGDFRNWLGERNVQWLESEGHAALVHKAAGEFTTLARQFAEPQPQQWQTLFFPVAVAGELQQARLFVKRDRRQGGSSPRDKKSEDTRFVVELELSRLGEMQMDGFVRRHADAVEFDMVVRSHLPLPDELQRGILQIYNDAGQITGYKGGLTFQSVREFPVKPMEEIMAHTPGKVVV